MKQLKYVIYALIAFSFLGMDSMPSINKEIKQAPIQNQPIRPTMDQRLQLTKSKLQILNSEVSVGIAELKFDY
jgi:hypothetical protein